MCTMVCGCRTMKAWLFLAVICCLSLIAQERPKPTLLLAHHTKAGAEIIDWTMESDSMERQGSTVILRGNAKITTKTIVVRADEMEFNETTSELKPRGNVRVQMAPIDQRL